MKPTEADLDHFTANVREQRKPLPRPEEWKNVVVHQDEVRWYQPKGGTNPSLLGPVLQLPTKTFEIFLQEIPPAEASDMQRHHHESVHYVLSGEGYSEIGAKSYSWQTGSFIYTPPMVWHRHYNSSDRESVKMLLIENSRLLDMLGLNYRVSEGLMNYQELLQKHQKQRQGDSA